MKSILQALLALVIFTVANTARAQLMEGEREVAQSYNAFGFKLLNQTREAYPGKNVFVSPAGLAFALSMLADGARGPTFREITKALQLTISPADLAQGNQALLGHLRTLDPAIKLEIANSVWIAQDAKINPQYLTDLRQFYQTDASSVDFTDPATAQRINGWCSEHTHGKIAKMVEPPLGEATRLILLDAIYFKGAWLEKFPKERTKDLPFTMGDGKVVHHPLMEQEAEFQYFEDDDCKAVELPYAGAALNMYVFLPKPALSEFMAKLTPSNWQQWISQFHSRHGTLKLPRFRLENSYDLKAILKAFSIRAAFDASQANFAGVSEQSLYLSQVEQNTYLDVNEDGTEAIAISYENATIGMNPEPPPPPFQMIVDHPFFVAICDRQTGIVLFLGAIVDPR